MLVSGPWHVLVCVCVLTRCWHSLGWWGRRKEHVCFYRKSVRRDTRRKVHWSLSLKRSLSFLKRKLQTSACFTHGMLNIDHQRVKSCFFESKAKGERETGQWWGSLTISRREQRDPWGGQRYVAQSTNPKQANHTVHPKVTQQSKAESLFIEHTTPNQWDKANTIQAMQAYRFDG